ncbi:MAG TPA: translation elongation factor Ts, partial [Ignavibacteria bacterium]
ALEESGGDFEKAIEYLRKKGAATSQKRSDRIAKEGIILAKTNSDRKEAAIVEINCETDFVGRSESFRNFMSSVLDIIFKTKSGDLNTILQSSNGTSTVQQMLDGTTASVGEKVEIKRALYFKSGDGFFCDYNHMGNKLASVVELTGKVTDKSITLGNDLAMQVAAMNPISIDRSGIPAEKIAAEKEIYLTQARNEKKPDNVAEKIVNNKVEKFYQENCLIEQEFVKEPDKTVGDVINTVSKETGNDYKVKTMVRYQLGETLA